MSDHIIKQNPFATANPVEARSQNGPEEHNQPLAVRIGYGAPETQPKTDDTKSKPSDTASKPDSGPAKLDSSAAKTGDSLSKSRDKSSDSTTAANPKIETQPIYDIQKLYAQVQDIQRSLVASCFEKQSDGTYKPRDDKAKVQDGSKDGTTVEVVRSALISQMSDKYEKAVTLADTAMKNPDAVIAATMSAKTQLEATQLQTKNIQQELKAQGIEPAVGAYLDTTLINRFLDDHKELSTEQREKVTSLRDSLQKQSQLEFQYRDLRILQETPIVARSSYAEFLRTIGLPNAADKWMNDAKKVSDDLSSTAGRSDFMKRQIEQTTKDKDESLDKTFQEKYLKPQQILADLVGGAAAKAKAGDLDAARADMNQARVLAAKMPNVDKQDEDQIRSRGDHLKKEREDLNQKLKDGTATPHDVTLQQERELKLINEARLLDAAKTAKPSVDIAYADFLLNADKDKGSESNRKYARDILMDVKFDNVGKLAAMQSGEQFDKLLEQSLNGNIDNQAGMEAFNRAMKQYDALLKKASGLTEDGRKAEVQPTEEEITKCFKDSRSMAGEAAQIASRLNRDAADGNQKAVQQRLQKQIDLELAKPVAERDQGKITLMQTVMKPNYQLNTQEKQLTAGLLECLKPKGQADKATIDNIAGMLKDKSALFDIVSSYSLIQQTEMQKQAVNQARIAMLNIDVAFDKGENNPLVGDIERDKYGGDMINALNSIPGHDGRSQWGDVKEATRDLAWYETAWKWTKGAIKEVAISLASWAVGAAAGLGAAALFSWTGPGAVIGGGAVGFAAGAATGSAIRYVIGDKVSPLGVVMDGVSGLTGGVMGTTYAVARGAGTAAMENVIAQQAERGVTIGAGQTWTAFKAAGLANKFAIAAGGSGFTAGFTASMAGSAAYHIPTEAITGNYQNLGAYAEGTGFKILKDVPANVLGSWVGGRIGSTVENKIIGGGGNYFNSAARQLTSNFLWNSPEVKNMFTGVPKPRRSAVNEHLYDLFQPKEQDDQAK